MRKKTHENCVNCNVTIIYSKYKNLFCILNKEDVTKNIPICNKHRFKIVNKKSRNKKYRKSKGISDLKNEADRLASLYIRDRDKWTCITCGVQNIDNKDKTKEPIQNGHYFSRVEIAIRYDERNQNAQCRKCNFLHELNKVPYTKAIINRYGSGIIEKLTKKIQLYQATKKRYTILDYHAIIQYYKNKLGVKTK